MIEEIRVSFITIKNSNVNMFILCDLKGQCLNHDHVAHEYESLRMLVRSSAFCASTEDFMDCSIWVTIASEKTVLVGS